MRPQPKTPPPDVTKRNDLGLITETRRYKLITPLFGGGVEPGKADPITVVRATEVRGHLRFWWRATRGGQFNGDLSAMKAAEDAIWGSAAAKDKPGPSAISIALHATERGKPFQALDRHGKPIANIGHPNSKHGYVAFPLRDSENLVVLEDFHFDVVITFRKTLQAPFDEADVREEVNAAFWAWETFGGIGARTRRGFGALQLKAIDGEAVSELRCAEVEEQLNRMLRQYVASGKWPESVPHLSQTMNMRVFQYDANQGAPDVWLDLITALAKFRQAPNGRPPGTRATGNRPGRSYWPEPDEIRRLTGTHKPSHRPSHPVRKFPRAAFGLPIIFEFKRGDVPPEPWKTTLQGVKHDRLASPLIIRPITCNDGAVGLVAILEAPVRPPGGWLLKDAPNSQQQIDAKLTSKAEADAIKPLKDVGSETDVLLAFLKSL